jgi:hypothetical protein
MSKFVFPITEAQFLAVLKPEAKKLFAALGDEEDPNGRAFSYLRAGFLSRMHHKSSSSKSKEEVKAIKAAIAKDPALKARILGTAAAKTS